MYAASTGCGLNSRNVAFGGLFKKFRHPLRETVLDNAVRLPEVLGGELSRPLRSSERRVRLDERHAVAPDISRRPPRRPGRTPCGRCPMMLEWMGTFVRSLVAKNPTLARDLNSLLDVSCQTSECHCVLSVVARNLKLAIGRPLPSQRQQ